MSDARPIALVWFRQDLRLDDNPALSAALHAGFRPIPVYIHMPDQNGVWPLGAAQRPWLLRSLTALSESLEALGSGLLIRQGDCDASLRELIEATGAQAVFWNRCYEPASIARDRRIKAALRDNGLRVDTFNAGLLLEPWQVATQQNGPYRVFTPYWRKAATLLDTLPQPDDTPSRLPPLPTGRDGRALRSEPIHTLALHATPAWDSGFWSLWQPGEAGAWQRWTSFSDELRGYTRDRDIPSVDGTSMLSPHLHFGEISPRRLLDALRQRRVDGSASVADDAFLRELGWREFSHHLLYHFPHSPEHDLTEAMRGFPWREPTPAMLRAWQRGRTGVPIVDAGMRQLWHSGWMHNRVRMLVASYLTKHLRVHWRHGARWFWDTLVDADLANNTQGWQWSAGTGADAAPYFRIFNPVTQGQRFDPQGEYVRRWVPELRGLPDKAIHSPWLLFPDGVAGYPRRPLVDLAHGRAQALLAYRQRGAS